VPQCHSNREQGRYREGEGEGLLTGEGRAPGRRRDAGGGKIAGAGEEKSPEHERTERAGSEMSASGSVGLEAFF
jgi:hypothetical protein